MRTFKNIILAFAALLSGYLEDGRGGKAIDDEGGCLRNGVSAHFVKEKVFDLFQYLGIFETKRLGMGHFLPEIRETLIHHNAGNKSSEIGKYSLQHQPPDITVFGSA